MYDSRRLVIRTWSRFFIRTSGSIAARSSGWYISFIAAFYRRPPAARRPAIAGSVSRPRRRAGRGVGQGRRSRRHRLADDRLSRTAAGRSVAPAGPARCRHEERRSEADGGEKRDRSGQVAREPDRSERELEAAKPERGDVGRSEDAGATADLPVE